MSNQAPENPIAPGTILAGKYRVDRVLGQGGMGVVVEARHIALEERVALKFLLPEYATHPEASARFLREARAAVKIKSEHVARVSDVGTLDTGAPYMVMEYLDGHDLRGELEKMGVLKLEDAVDYLIQGCEAIAEAHSYGIVHRDLKPANLFLTKRANGTPLVKVLDFGISKVSGNAVDNLTKTTAAMGSALYMSPEQMQATRGVDHRTDIYALGISLYELLAGRQPFYADTLPQLCAEVFTGTPAPIRQMRPDLPEAFAVVLEKAYARDRATRYQSVAEFVIALAPWAPPRSRPTIESVAKLAGMEAPAPGAPPPAFVPPAQGGTQLMPQAAPAPVALSGSDPSAQRVSGVPEAAAIPTNSASMVSVVNTPPKPSSKGPLIAMAIVGVLGIGGVGAFFATRSTAATQPAPGAPVVTQTAALPAATTAQATPPPAQTATAAPTAAETAPTVTATAAPTVAVAVPPGKAGASGAGKTQAGAGANKGQTTTPPPKKDVAGF